MTGKPLSHTAADCIEAYKDLATKGSVTRDRYRKESGIAESVWEYHFGTFAELKRQAGAAPNPTEKKLHTAVAKATSAKRFDPVNKERADYGDKYLRKDASRYKTMVVASDLHDKEIDPFYLRVFLDTCKRVQPDVVSLGGDVFDLPEFGRYTVDPREWDAVGRIKFTHDNIFAPLRDNCPDAQIDLIEGNHECVEAHTEVLTCNGWMRAMDYYGLKARPPIASLDLNTHAITYNAPVAVAMDENRDLYEIETTFKKEVITDNHSVIYNGVRRRLDTIEHLEGDKFLNAVYAHPAHEMDMDRNIVQLALWIITHGTIRRTEHEYKYWLSFKVPRRIERRIKSVVQTFKGMRWIKTPKGIEVEGPQLAAVIEMITGLQDVPDCTRWDRLPDWFGQLSPYYGEVVAEELTWASTQSFMTTRTTYYNGFKHALGESLQWFMITRGVPCAMRYLPLDQYILTFNETGVLERWRGRRVKKKQLDKGVVVSIQTKDGTLITRIDGKINFTGNCRLVKQLADFSPATRAVLGDLHGWTIADLFGLPKFHINYVAKADLKSYTERDHKKELENNYRVYWNNVMVHHFPHARNLGLPGVNGHHHSHVVWPMYNVHQGSYEWHQLGAGHRRKASYCEGEKWHNGFAIIHVDTVTKSVNIEYVPITAFAVVGGKMYTREPHEMIEVIK